MRWGDIDWTVHEFTHRKCARIQVGELTLSIIAEQEPDLYEVAIMESATRQFVSLYGINDAWDDDVIRFVTAEEVIGLIRKVGAINGADAHNEPRD